ncbi:OLC1v1010214C1 [Oldenlandia corymbosa var. corymbosa]|uniref:OLC1v1010214C1 n=1 Tax=Oldenlandia corymbosa var. corymbosa TaxID=529605 RepID=A0AAV1DT99_OLDCO|nr:OLC1v1010214C1 [Oldenlandia corymbosa var. corymbosa]
MTVIENQPKSAIWLTLQVSEMFRRRQKHAIRSQQSQQRLQQEQHQPSDSLRVVIKDETANVDRRPKSPESDWLIRIRQKVEDAHQNHRANTWSRRCIYRIPQCLRESNDKGYHPQVVSLGPYHHNKRRLRSMETHKWRAVLQILKRTNQDIKLYLGAMKELEERARACYEGPIPLSSEEFVEMMVLDGCFILELFRGSVEGFNQLGYSTTDPVFSTLRSMHSIQRDMIMLENQIPLFVLERLFSIQQIKHPEHIGTVSELALRFVNPLMPTDEPSSTKSTDETAYQFDPLPELVGEHCLAVFWRSILRKGSQPRTTVNETPDSVNSVSISIRVRQQLIHGATELRDSGIHFRKRETDRFWDIKFKDGVLEIPRLLIHDGTMTLFLNLIAFEQCHLGCPKYITSYVIFMDNLISSPEDVSILHNCGVMEHWLGSDSEVANLFNRLCQEVVFDKNDSYLSSLSAQVNDYCDNRWHTWRATLCNKYFNSPWAVIIFIAAVVSLLLAFIQAFFGVYAYYRPSTPPSPGPFPPGGP